VAEPSGRPVAGAAVELVAGATRLGATADAAGRFRFDDLPAGEVTVRASAPRHAPAERTARLAGGTLEIDITLPPSEVSATITVTAARAARRLADTPAAVTVLSADDLAAGAATTVDTALRQIPGFSLFRRTDSRFANPTTQGASLRGLGASGASRAAVLADGVPLNDPFGGWVAWGRVPRAAIASLEVLSGAASDLYGSAALSGVVDLVRRTAAAPAVTAEASYGELATGDASLFAAERRGPWGATAAAEGARTGGYVAVPAPVRGPVDTPVDSRRSALEVTLERRGETGPGFFLRGSAYGESRDNGTPLQTNSTSLRQWSAGGDWSGWGAGRGSLALRAFGGDQLYRQSFSGVAADRASEQLTRLQRVPADDRGGSVEGTYALGGGNVLLAGIDLRAVGGASRERVITAAGVQPAEGEGRQESGGLYVEDLAELGPRWSATLGVRLDAWRNLDARLASAAATTHLADRSERAASPRAALRFRASDRLSLSAAAYRGFRAPTLNELYRTFRVGNVVTQANPGLAAERLAGGELGALYTARGGRVTARATLFSLAVDDAVSNVTLSTTPSLITRRRENLGRTRSRGIEAEATARLGGRWSLTGGWLLSDARVVSFPADRTLEGRFVPQVPRQQLLAEVRRDGERSRVGVAARWIGRQFDDDQNRFPLGGFVAVDARAARTLGRGLSIFAAGENLLDRRYDAARTPTLTVGPPRLLRIGLRIDRGG
jgi:outer membrane receptor protein involved in Fe transport